LVVYTIVSEMHGQTNVRFNGTRSSGSWVALCRRKDR